MAKHTRKLAGIRIGPITILVFVITLCIAVLATLSVTTARANTASTERQISFTNDVYANETAAQTMLSLVDAALANGTDEVRANLSAIEKETQAAARPGSVTVTLSGNTLDALFETDSGRQLIVELELSESTYEIVKWKTAMNWKEESNEKLWAG